VRSSEGPLCAARLKRGPRRVESSPVSDLDAAPDRELAGRMRDGALAALHALGGDARVDAIRAWVVAHGNVAPDGHGRPIDHALLRALASLRADGLVEDRPSARWALAREAGGRLAELRAMSYADYLQTPDWPRTRADALERAGGCCRVDERHREQLEVHHRSVERLGAELEDDLVVLCRSCHVLYRRAYGVVSREAPAEQPPQEPVPVSRRGSRRLVVAHLPFR
jgi:stage V sporulation protein SpoVS